VSHAIKDLIQNKVVCELGCAEGDNMVFMSRYAKKVIGVEVNPKRYKPAQDRGLEIIVADYLHDDIPEADVYYFWPNLPDRDNEFLIDKILSNDSFNGTIIVGGDTGFPPDPVTINKCLSKFGGVLREVPFNEGPNGRQSGVFLLAIITK
jgi:hypothetical protein